MNCGNCTFWGKYNPEITQGRKLCGWGLTSTFDKPDEIFYTSFTDGRHCTVAVMTENGIAPREPIVESI